MSAASKLTAIMTPCLSCSVLGKDTTVQTNDGVSTLPSNSPDCVKTYYNP